MKWFTGRILYVFGTLIALIGPFIIFFAACEGGKFIWEIFLDLFLINFVIGFSIRLSGKHLLGDNDDTILGELLDELVGDEDGFGVAMFSVIGVVCFTMGILTINEGNVSLGSGAMFTGFASFVNVFIIITKTLLKVISYHKAPSPEIEPQFKGRSPVIGPQFKGE